MSHTVCLLGALQALISPLMTCKLKASPLHTLTSKNRSDEGWEPVLGCTSLSFLSLAVKLIQSLSEWPLQGIYPSGKWEWSALFPLFPLQYMTKIMTRFSHPVSRGKHSLQTFFGEFKLCCDTIKSAPLQILTNTNTLTAALKVYSLIYSLETPSTASTIS